LNFIIGGSTLDSKRSGLLEPLQASQACSLTLNLTLKPLKAIHAWSLDSHERGHASESIHLNQNAGGIAIGNGDEKEEEENAGGWFEKDEADFLLSIPSTFSNAIT